MGPGVLEHKPPVLKEWSVEATATTSPAWTRYPFSLWTRTGCLRWPLGQPAARACSWCRSQGFEADGRPGKSALVLFLAGQRLFDCLGDPVSGQRFNPALMASLTLRLPIVHVDGNLAAATGTVSLHSWTVITRHIVFSPMTAGEQSRTRRAFYGGDLRSVRLAGAF